MKWLIHPHQPRPDGSLSNQQLLRLVRGSSRVYWGIVLALILGTQLVKVDLLAALHIPPLHFRPNPLLLGHYIALWRRTHYPTLGKNEQSQHPFGPFTTLFHPLSLLVGKCSPPGLLCHKRLSFLGLHHCNPRLFKPNGIRIGAPDQR